MRVATLTRIVVVRALPCAMLACTLPPQTAWADEPAETPPPVVERRVTAAASAPAAQAPSANTALRTDARPKADTPRSANTKQTSANKAEARTRVAPLPKGVKPKAPASVVRGERELWAIEQVYYVAVEKLSHIEVGRSIITATREGVRVVLDRRHKNVAVGPLSRGRGAYVDLSF